MTNADRKTHVNIEKVIYDTRLAHMGLPMWHHREWQGKLLSRGSDGSQSLREYSRVFSSVEGNTTFYGLPDKARLSSWLNAVPEGFRFCFKVPRDISHRIDPVAAYLGKSGRAWQGFVQQILDTAPEKLGSVMLQLPSSFSPGQIGALERLLDSMLMHQEVPISVECRHSVFFDKGVGEKALLRLLADRNLDRVIFDSRGLMQDDSFNDDVLDARRKKPKFPVHPIATGQRPVIRFIGHSDFVENRTYLDQWLEKLKLWRSEGREPLFFWHTAGNQNVPDFYRDAMRYWGCAYPASWPAEEGPGVSGDLWS